MSGPRDAGPPASTDEGLARYLTAAASRYPERTAVRERDRELSYARLDELSAAIARAMRQAGLEPGARVGIWLNKSIEAIVGIWAVLRAGCAYVPIDPTAPARRAAHVISDCALSWLLTSPDRADALGRRDGGPRLLLAGGPPAAPGSALSHALTWDDAVRRGSGAAPQAAPAAGPDVAYILYTSGSTGVPKGVILTHGNARAFVDWATAEFALRPDDVLASHAPLHFDLAVLHVFGAAAAGAGLELIPEAIGGNGYALTRFVADRNVSVWYSVPGTLRRMAAAASAGLLARSRLRVVAFAGEVYHTSDLRELRAVLPGGAILYNLYGPTETNVCSYHQVSDADLVAGAPAAPPIGVACPYADLQILEGDPAIAVGPGEAAGELCVGGASVMPGYWGDPDLTRLRLSGPPGLPGRYYRTGDFVRRDRAGRYFFLGRRDGMVKVKGYRVELGEVEAVISQHPEVAEAACVAVADPGDGASLAGFAALRPGSAADEAALRRHCSRFLPRYMVPPRITLVGELPRTSTGKIDRRELSAAAARGSHAQ